MAESILWGIFIIFLLLNLLFTATRTSLIETRIPYLMGMQQEKPAALERTIKLLEKPRLKATLRSGVVVIHFLLAVTIWFLLMKYLALEQSVGLALAAMVLAAAVVLALEFIVEGIILQKCEAWAVRLTGVGSAMDVIFSPFALVMRGLQTGDALERSLAGVTEDELKTWVEVGGKSEGSLEQGERKMIYSIFHFSDTLCREVMVPRIDVFALEANTTLPEAVEGMILSGHSRVPVYDDVIDNIIGLLYAKDLLKSMIDKSQSTRIRDLLRPAYFIPEAKKVDELLREMQARGVHIAIVVDEYGGMAGLVTLEDIVEEIVGEIRDEYDQSEELLYQEINPSEYIFQGRIDLDDFNEILETNLTKDIADTLGGFIYGEIGRVPAEGEQVRIDGWVLTVEQVIGRRIRMVRAKKYHAGEMEEQVDGFE